MTDLARVDIHVSRVMNAAHTPEESIKRAYTASQLYSEVGEFDKALAYIDMYLTAYQSDASAFYLRGTILEKKGSINDAISAYCNSLSLKPKQRDVTIKICEVFCSVERPPEDQLAKWLEQARKVAAPPRLLQSLEEKLALAKGDAQTLESLYNEQVKRSPDDLLTYRKLVNLKLCLSDLAGAKKLVDQINARLPQAAENLDWIQVCYDMYYRTYISFMPVEGGSQQMEIYPLLSGMLGNLSSTFILKLSSDHKHPKETLRHFDSHLTAMYSALEKFPGNPAHSLPQQLRFKEYCAHFYQLSAYLLFKLAYDQVLDLGEMLQLAAVCLSISFSITPPSTRDEATEEILHLASSRMCEVGYLMAALTRLNGQEWLRQTVKPMISVEGISRIIEVLELQDTRQTPCCLRLPTIYFSQVQCTSPSRNHLARYHEAYLRDHLDQLPFLTWLALAEVSAYGGHPSLPQSFSNSEHRFNSFPDGCEDLSRTDYSSCSRMDVEAFLYMSFYETQQLESTAESCATVLLPIVLHKLSVPGKRCLFWSSLIALDRAPETNISTEDFCKYKTTIEMGLFAIRCLKRMELPTLIVYNIAEAFDQRLTDCTKDSPSYSEERQRLLVARNELYWTETLRRLKMSEAGVSSIPPDDSISNCLAVKLLSLQGKKAVEEFSEERRKAMLSRAEMMQADLSLHRNHILKAVSIYERLDLPQAAWNHAQLLKMVALSGNSAIISRTQLRPSTAYDLLVRSQTILSQWTSREEVKLDLQLKQSFETEIQSLDKSIRNHKYLENSPEHSRESNQGNVDNLNSGTFDRASATSFSFPPQSASPHSTPKRNIPNCSETLTSEEQQLNMELRLERMSLELKEKDDIISELSKNNVELRGMVQNLQYYFTDQKVLFKKPKDPKNAILRPEDLDNLPTLQVPPFNNSASSNKSHTPLNSYQGDLASDVLSPQIPNQGADFECEETQLSRPMLSVNNNPNFQDADQTSGKPFANLSLMGTGSGQAAPTRVPFQLNLSASGSGLTEPALSSKDKSLGSLVKANTSDNTEDFVCTAEHDALVNLPIVNTETGEECEEVLFCQRGKLFRYRDNTWVERGVGEMKVLQQRDEHKFRLLMRREIVMKLCCNHLILPNLELKPLTERSVLWSTHADFSEQTDSESLTLAIRFKTPEFKDQFVESVNKCKHILKHSTRLKPSSDTPLNLPSPQKQSKPMSNLLPLSAQPPCLSNPRSLHRPLNHSYSDSDVLSNTLENEPALDSKGPLRITSCSGEQILFEERTFLTVNENKVIHDYKSIRVRIIGDSDRAQYRTILEKEGAVLFDIEIRDICDYRKYATTKNDKSWCLTLNNPEDQLKTTKFIVRLLTTAASEKFNAVMQDCILKSKTHATSTTTVQSENVAPSTPEKSSKSVFGMGALSGFTFSSQEHGQHFASTPAGTFLNPTPTPTAIPTPSATDGVLDSEESNTPDTSYETDHYFEPVVVLPELKVFPTGEEQEDVIFLRRARLYRFLDKEWKERGIGELKILRNPETGKNRIVMRRDVIKKLCCNHYITHDMKIQVKLNSAETMNWYTPADFADEVQQPEILAARFKTVEFASEFEKIFNQCRLGVKPSQSPRKAEAVVEPSTDTKTDFATDDVIIISVSQPTEDQIRRARELMLPDYFYLYEDKPGCPGCRGCEESIDIIPEDNTEIKMQPRDEEIPVKPGSIFEGNLANFSFSSLTQTSSTNPFTKPGKSVNEDTGDADKQNVPDPPAATGAERVLFSRRAALHTIVSLEWKQRGEGDLKLFHNQEMGKYRLEMRRDPGEGICCRHFITADIKLGLLEEDERTCVWDAVSDSSEETPQNERFSVRFNTPDTANEFRETFEECQLELMNHTLVPCSTSPTTTTTDTADIVPDTKHDKTPDTNSNSNNEDNSCRGAEPADTAELSTDDIIFVCAYEPTPAQLAITEQYQLPKYFFSYEDKPPCSGCRGCFDDFDIVYEKDTDPPDQPRAVEYIKSKVRDASANEDDSTYELKEEIVKPSLFDPHVDRTISFTKLAQSDNLPIVKTETGEECEEVLFCQRGKLVRYRDKKWVERGVGEMKVLRKRDEHKFRLLMRREMVMKLCCNHVILSTLELKPLTERSVMWSTYADFSEQTDSELLTLAIQFKTPEFKDQFVEAVNKCKPILEQSMRLGPAPVGLASNASPQKFSPPLGKLQQSNPRSDVAPGFSCQGNPFKSYARPLFAASSETGGDSAESEPDAHLQPIVQLPEIQDLRTGEEELFNKYTVLFRFHDKHWKERGRGYIKILYNKDTEKYRIFMLHSQVKKLCCNHFITSMMVLEPFQKFENSWLWHTASDSSEEEPRRETLAVKFKKPDVANEFKLVFDKCVSSLQALE